MQSLRYHEELFTLGLSLCCCHRSFEPIEIQDNFPNGSACTFKYDMMLVAIYAGLYMLLLRTVQYSMVRY